MKKCTKCGEVKDFSEFHKRANRPNGLRGECKSCRSKLDAELFQRKREQRQATARKWAATNLLNTRHAVYDYLAYHPCVDCGESDIVVLEFDHVRGEKKMAVSTMVARHKSISEIFEEIDKCEVRCANCHRRATAMRAGWQITSFQLARQTI